MAYDRFKQSIKYAIPFTNRCFSPEVLTLEAGYIRAFIPYSDIYNGAIPGTMHAAAFTIIVDHLAGFTAWSMLDQPSKFINTVDLSFNFLHPFPIGNIVIDTKCIDIGHKIAFLEAKVYTCKPLPFTASELGVLKHSNNDNITSGTSDNNNIKKICSSKEPDQLLATSFGTFNIYELSKLSTIGFDISPNQA